MSDQPQLSLTGRYRDFFFRIDPRSLGLFRILLALVLIALWVFRWRWLGVMYTDSGVLPREILTELGARYFPYTPLAWIGGEWGVRLFFLGALVSYLLLLVGYRTRLASVLSWAFFVSISHRNPYVLIGADFVLASMLTWTMFLPLGKRFSVDALRRAMRSSVPLVDRAGTSSSEWNAAPLPAVEKAPASAAAFFVVLHFGLIYLFTGVWKTGITWWEEGTALYYVLHMEQSLFPLGSVMAEAPIWLLKSIAYGTLILEYIALPAFLIPWGQPWIRRLTLIALAGFHLGIALTVDAGVFSYAMLACFPLLMLPRDWDALARFGRRFSRPVTAYYDDNCGICTACCKALKVSDRFGQIAFIGNSQTEEFRHKVKPELTERTIVVFDERTGQQATQSAGVAMLLRSLPFPWPLLAVMGLPGVRSVCDIGYRLVANNRARISQLLGMAACAIPQPGESSSEVTPATGRSNPNSPVKQTGAMTRAKWRSAFGNGLASAWMLSVLCGMYFQNVVPIFKLQPDAESNVNRVGVFVAEATYAAQANQYWNMFAPDAPTVDAWWVAEAQLLDGRKVDLFQQGRPSDLYRQPKYWETPFNSVWGNYLRHTAALGLLMPPEMIPEHANQHADVLRRAILRFVLREYEKTDGPEITDLKLFLVIKSTPPPAQPEYHSYMTLSTQTYELVESPKADPFSGPDHRGVEVTYNAQGAKIREGERDPWNRLQMEGYWIFWDDDGRRRVSEGDMVNGVRHGFWKHYRHTEQGTDTSEGRVVKGQREGEWKTKHPHGGWTTETYRLGALHGPWRTFFRNGSTQIEGRYDSGQQIGLWHFYSANGQTEQVREYKNGKPHGQWITIESGITVQTETYKDGVLDGPWLNAWPNGQVESQGHYAEGKRVGTWQFFHADGSKNEVGQYVDGKKHGEWTVWITAGITHTRTYEQGRPVN
ncbi:MAG: DCC1-like thiol-disulfide oxidoreductase family protein [Pirellulales bacterium]|nr:DCC1-like thiol-disulfide oxidoreductase family protein [Pirellulales bacterium]